MEFVVFLIVAFVLVACVLAWRAAERMNRPPPLSGMRESAADGVAKDLETAVGFLSRAAGKVSGNLVGGAKSAYRAQDPRPHDASDGTVDLSRYEALEKLQSLLEKGAISSEEFEHEKRRLLGREA